MKSYFHCLFETPIGQCGLVWSSTGISRVRFPSDSDDKTLANLLRGIQSEQVAPPPTIAVAIAQINRLLHGETVDLSGLPMDLDGVADFHKRVYIETLKIPAGKTATYGDIAFRVGEPKAAQAVGQALGRNPIPIVVPCHRVLAAGGELGGFSGTGGGKTKRRLLEIEGALPPEPPSLFDFDD